MEKGLTEQEWAYVYLLCPMELKAVEMIKSRRMRWVGHIRCMDIRDAYNIFVGKPEGKDNDLLTC
jgi:hypothetical protein